MNEYTTYVGMDAHARSITCKGLDVTTGERFDKTFVDCPSAEVIHSWMSGLPQPVYCAYESGCTGFWLARGLRELGVSCDVIAVSTLPRSTKDKQGKCDKLDAKVILREILNPLSDCSPVWIPDAEVEGARDLARARQDAVKAAKSAKQKVASLLMRHHYIWNEKTPTGKLKKPWRKDYRAWLDKITLPDPNAQAALEHYRRAVKRAEEEVAEVDRLLRAEAAKPRWKPYVDALVHLKGIDELNAFLAAAEFGCFSRFEGGRKVSCWAGTVPSNHSSGEKEAHGGITRAGAPHLRHGLVEGCCGLDRWGTGEKVVKGHPASPDVVAAANKANARLRKRYRYLRDERGKTPNKAKVAVVNELVRWIWVIGRMVEGEQAA